MLFTWGHILKPWVQKTHSFCTAINPNGKEQLWIPLGFVFQIKQLRSHAANPTCPRPQHQARPSGPASGMTQWLHILLLTLHQLSAGLSPDPHFGIPAGPLLSHNGLKQLGGTIPIWKVWMSSSVTACYAQMLQGNVCDIYKRKGAVAPVALGWLQVQRFLLRRWLILELFSSVRFQFPLERRVWSGFMLSGQSGWVERSKPNGEQMKSVFIWSCYPCKVLEGGERQVPFVRGEVADGCNPLQNVHRKSVKNRVDLVHGV